VRIEAALDHDAKAFDREEIRDGAERAARKQAKLASAPS
jgi:hypothetical protein